MAEDHDLESVALPAISTGIYGYPMEDAAEVMLRAALDYAEGGTDLRRIVFCLYGQSSFDVFAKEFEAQTE
jgi:O-acetyl-ADP-ribose deacetylase (regulator of RNase III)